MNMHNRLIHVMLLALAVVLGSGVVAAQGLTIDITNGNPSALPVAVVPFAYQGSSTPPETDIGDVIRAGSTMSRAGRCLRSDRVRHCRAAHEWRAGTSSRVSVHAHTRR